MVEIYNILKYNDTSYQVDYALRIIEELTGHYNLDPNRTLDILIELYSNNFVGNQDFAIDLLRRIPMVAFRRERLFFIHGEPFSRW